MMEKLERIWDDGRELFYSLGGTLIWLLAAYLYATAPVVDELGVLMSLLLAMCCFTVTISIVIIVVVEKIKNKR